MTELEHCHELAQEIIANGLANGWLSLVNRRHGIYVTRMDGDGKRFADIFRVTLFERIPLGPRRRILKHWRTPGRFTAINILWPTIELLTDWSGRDGDGVRGDIAAAYCNQHRLNFHSEIIDRMPDNIVADLIAHELAHVVQDAFGIVPMESDNGITIHVDPDGGEFLPGDLEEWADDLMSMWGFDPNGMDHWAVKEGIARVRQVTQLEAFEAYERFELFGAR